MIDLYTVTGLDLFGSVQISHPEFCLVFFFFLSVSLLLLATNLRHGSRDASEKSLVVSDSYYVSYQNRSIVNSAGYAEVERKGGGLNPTGHTCSS